MPTTIADISEVLFALGLEASVSEKQRGLAQECLRSANSSVMQRLQYDPKYSERTEFYPQNDFRRGDRVGIWEVDSQTAFLRDLAQGVTTELQLKGIPLREIVSLKVDYDGRFGTRSGSFADETAFVEGTDFWGRWDSLDSAGVRVCMDGILISEGRWPDTPGSVKVVYKAGYNQKELHGQDDVLNARGILDAVIDEAVRRFLMVMNRSKKRLAGFSGPLTSENLGDYSYSVNSEAFNRLIGGVNDLLPETEQKLAPFCKMDMGVL